MDQSPFIVGGEGKGEDFRRDHSLFWGKLTANEGGGSNKNTTKLRGCGGGGEQVNLIVTRPKILRPKIFL